MLPTSGYFRDIICPYLKSGLCERPHCHYKHDIRYEVKASKTSTSSVHSKSSLPEVIPDYVPTPVSQLRSSRSNSVAEADTASVSDGIKGKTKFQNIYKNIPEYKPTPISQLKKQQIGNYSDDEVVPKKQKKEENVTDAQSSSEPKKKSIEKHQKNKNAKKDEIINEHKLNKSPKSNDKSKNKSEIPRKGSSDQSSGFESDTNEDVSPNGIGSKSRKKSFTDIIGSADESQETSQVVSKKMRIAHQNTSNIVRISLF